MSTHKQWARVLGASAGPDRAEALGTAMELGFDVSPDVVGCSVTELDGALGRTPAWAGDVALTLDEAQYDADAGPCLTAAREGTAEQVEDTVDQDRYPAFGAAVGRQGVRSALSLSLPGTDRPAALNFYASVPAAFDSVRARDVAGLLARSVATLLRDGSTWSAVPAEQLAAALASRARIVRAQEVLMAPDRLDRRAAFAQLVRRSHAERRSVSDVVDDVLGDGLRGHDLRGDNGGGTA